MHILLLNLTNGGIHNVQSLRAIRNACTSYKGADDSHYLTLDVGTQEVLLHRYSGNYNTHIVMLRQYGFNFITCSGVHPKNKINAFVRPFDRITWTCLIITIAAIAACTLQRNRVDIYFWCTN